jgi:hypothetical protein
MANFAKLDNTNIVTNIIHVEDINSSTEEEGISFLKKTSGPGTYVQYWEDGSQRKRAAAIGSYYDLEKNIFYHPKPYNSWVWSENEKEFIAPISKPSIDLINRPFPYTDLDVMNSESIEQYVTRLQCKWDEDRLTWVASEYTTVVENEEIKLSPTGKNFQWNSTNSTWSVI